MSSTIQVEMAATSESESEILLGNKQLLGVFAVVAILLAVAFTGGYMLGKNSADKAAAGVETAGGETGMTKTVAPEESNPAKTEEPATEPSKRTEPSAAPAPIVKTPFVEAKHETILGAPKTTVATENAPRPGQTFLQVSALTHTQAEATAEVLRKQNFHARTALKPGTALYRVLVGPVADAGELASTRDSLRKIGFRDVIVQRY